MLIYFEIFFISREGVNVVASLVEAGIGVMVAVIVIGAVAIPVVIDVIDTTNFTGYSMTETIIKYVPVALALGLFVGAISIVR